jgi:putative endonuclease
LAKTAVETQTGSGLRARLARALHAPRRLARRGEKLAARHLRRRGCRILCRNVRLGYGEIDLVVLDGSTLVFVEVKSQSEKSWSDGLEKIDHNKKRALRSACRRYLRSVPGPVESYRVDAVCVTFRSGRLRPRLVDIRWYPAVLDLD